MKNETYRKKQFDVLTDWQWSILDLLKEILKLNISIHRSESLKYFNY